MSKRMTCKALCLAAASTCLTGCSEPAGKVKDAASELKSGMSEVAKGLDSLSKIDPIALNKLLDENKALENQLLELQRKTSSFGRVQGAIEVSKDSKLYFEFTGYSGSLRIDAWVDNETNKLVQNQVLSNGDPKPNFSAKICTDEIEAIAQSTWRQHMDGLNMDGHLWSDAAGNEKQGRGVGKVNAAVNAFLRTLAPARPTIDDKWRLHADQVFNDFLKKPFSLPSGDMSQPFSIDSRFELTPGRHTVFLQVTPISVDSSGQWALNYRCFVKRAGGTEDVVSAGRIDSQTSLCLPGNPCPPIAAVNVFVKFAEPS